MGGIWLAALVVAAAGLAPAAPPPGAPPPAALAGLCASGPPLLVPSSVAGVPLDPHYAAMFGVDNHMIFDVYYSPPGASGRQTARWTEDCLVARVDARAGRLTATWMCRRSDRAQWQRRQWTATARGLDVPEFWPCEWSKAVQPVTRPPRRGAGKSEAWFGSWTRAAVDVRTPGQRVVPGWHLSSEGGSGAGTECSVSFARGLGVVDWEHDFGADDIFHEGLGARLKDCHGPQPAAL